MSLLIRPLSPPAGGELRHKQFLLILERFIKHNRSVCNQLQNKYELLLQVYPEFAKGTLVQIVFYHHLNQTPL